MADGGCEEQGGAWLLPNRETPESKHVPPEPAPPSIPLKLFQATVVSARQRQLPSKHQGHNACVQRLTHRGRPPCLRVSSSCLFLSLLFFSCSVPSLFLFSSFLFLTFFFLHPQIPPLFYFAFRFSYPLFVPRRGSHILPRLPLCIFLSAPPWSCYAPMAQLAGGPPLGEFGKLGSDSES